MSFFLSLRRSLLAALTLSVVTVIPARALSLEIEWTGAVFSFRVVGAEREVRWLLQHSEDGREWRDVVVLDQSDQGGDTQELELSPLALPVADPDAGRGLFRVVEYPEADRFYRDYLAARSRWRASGLTSYRYGFRWSTMIFWDGSIEVTEGEVSSYERLEAFPPFFEEPPMYRTIEGLFDRIADARARDAASIEVTWDPEFGYPRSAAIDQSLLIADEEQYWSTEFLEPIRQGEIR